VVPGALTAPVTIGTFAFGDGGCADRTRDHRNLRLRWCRVRWLHPW